MHLVDQLVRAAVGQTAHCLRVGLAVCARRRRPGPRARVRIAFYRDVLGCGACSANAVYGGLV